MSYKDRNTWRKRQKIAGWHSHSALAESKSLCAASFLLSGSSVKWGNNRYIHKQFGVCVVCKYGLHKNTSTFCISTIISYAIQRWLSSVVSSTCILQLSFLCSEWKAIWCSVVVHGRTSITPNLSCNLKPKLKFTVKTEIWTTLIAPLYNRNMFAY